MIRPARAPSLHGHAVAAYQKPRALLSSLHTRKSPEEQSKEIFFEEPTVMKSPKVRCAAVLCVLAAAAVVACLAGGSVYGQKGAGGSKTPKGVRASAAESLPGFDLASIDHAANACTDFNQFANGGWMAHNEIPPAYSRWGRFEMLAEQNNDVLHDIMESLAKRKNLKPGSNERKVADFYQSCMDETAIEVEGAKPLQPELDRVAAVKDLPGLEEEVARLHAHRVPALFSFGATQDYKDSRSVIAQANQGGLGLPDRDYYTKDDEKSKATRDEYVRHVARTFELLGDAPESAAAEARTVMNIETKLAETSATRVELRNPEARYHPMTKAQLIELMPHFDWGLYFRAINLPEVGKINVSQPNFLKGVDNLLTSIPVEDWKTYLRWHLANAASPLLSSKFVEESFNFNGKYMQGTKEMLPRWKRCVAATDRTLGEAVGQLYVERTFTPQSKAQTKEMDKNIINVLRDDLSTLSWMSNDTR